MRNKIMAKIISVVVLLIISGIFGYQNLTKVPLRLIIGKPVDINLIYIIIASFALGLLTSFVIMVLIRNKRDNNPMF